MFAFVRTLLEGWKDASTITTPRLPRRRRLTCEVLEDRYVPSLVGGEFHVNTRVNNVQSQAATASSQNGTSVVVWSHSFSSNDRDIYAQRFDRNGNPLGGELLITNTSRDEYDPAVAMDDNGNIVVVWTEGAGTARNIRALKLLANGSSVSPGFPGWYTPITVAGTGRAEYAPSVAMAANGTFAVSYTDDWTSTNPDILVRQFASNGTFLRERFVAVTTRPERNSSIAMAPDGRFAVAFESYYSGLDVDIHVRRYTAAGEAFTVQAMNSSSRRDLNPSIAMDRYGNSVVVFQALHPDGDFDIHARRIYSNGSTSGEFVVRGDVNWHETHPVVALHPTNGSFVVAYNYQAQNGAITTIVQATEVSWDNTWFTDYNLGGSRYFPSISINGDGRYLIAYSSSMPRSWVYDPLDGIFAQFGQL